jgi:uncharacterized protein involved in exopolysaccharide biosynthesis
MSQHDSQLILRIWAWRKILIMAIICGAVLSAIASLMMEEEFQSQVILFALPQQSIGAQFYEEVKTNDILEYGETEDAERLLQVLNSDRIRRSVIEQFNLWDHYEIDRTEQGSQAAMFKKYSGKVSASMTRFGSIVIDVFDKDPEVARDMANAVSALMDSVSNQLRNDRAMQAFHYAEQSLNGAKQEIEAMEEKLGELRSKGIYDFPTQIEGLNEQYATALADGQPQLAENIRQKMADLAPYANVYNKLTTQLESAYKQEAVLKKRYDLNKLDANSQIPPAFIVDRASAADKKARPVRWLITVMGSASVGFFALVWLLIQSAIKEND